MSEDELGSSGKHRGPGRAAPYALSRLSGPVSLVDVAREIERADQAIASTAGAKLELIAAQMQALRAQAEEVLAKASQDADLHRSEARFARYPGKTYHLYERREGERYWSLLAPADWGGAPPHRFVGSYRLEADQSWTPVDQTAARDRERTPIEELIKRARLPSGEEP